MFSKAGEGKKEYLIGDTVSGFFTWMGFGFLIGLPALTTIQAMILFGVGEVLDQLQRHRKSTGEEEPPGTAGKIQEGGAGTATEEAATIKSI